MIEQCPKCGGMMENGRCENCEKNKSGQNQQNSQFQQNYNQASQNGTNHNSNQNDPSQNGYQPGNNYTNNYNNFANYNNFNTNFGYQSPKSRIVALILCVLVGYWGIHYFYTGKIGMGIIYLITGGLCGIGWIVDIIRIAVGTFTDKFGRPLSQ